MTILVVITGVYCRAATRYLPPSTGNQTAAFQALVDQSANGDLIIVQAGNHYLATTVNVYKPITVRGENGSAIFKTGNYSCIDLNGSNVIIDNLYIDGANRPECCMRVFGHHNAIYNSTFRNGGNGLLIHYSYNNIVRGCKAYYNNMVGISQYASSDNQIAYCQMYENGAEGLTIDCGSHNARVHDNWIHHNNTPHRGVGGVGIDDADGAWLYANTIENNGSHGIRFQNNIGPCDATRVNGNTIRNNENCAVSFRTNLYPVTNFSFWNNTCTGNPGGTLSGTYQGVNPGKPGGSSLNSNRQEIFTQGSDLACWNTWWLAGTGWSGPVSLSGGISHQPCYAWRASTNELDVFVRGTDGYLYQNYWNSAGGWSGWGRVLIGGNPVAIAGAPAVCSMDANNIDVFARNSSNQLIQIYWRRGTWSSFNLGGNIISDPTVDWRPIDIMDVFARDVSGNLVQKSWSPSYGGWAAWGTVKAGGNPIAIAGTPAVCSRDGNNLDIYARNSSNQLITICWRAATGWSTTNLGESLGSDPIVTWHDINRINVYFRGTNVQGYAFNPWYVKNWTYGSPWAPSYSLGNLAKAPSIVLEEKSVSASEAVVVFPNPNNGIFTVVFKGGEVSNFELDVLNEAGAKVFAKSYTSSTQTVDLGQVSDGLYFVNIKSAGYNKTVKMMIKR